MKPFRFRLATLQRLREIHRDEMRAKLAEAFQAEQILAEQLRTVQTELDAMLSLQRQAVAQGKTDINAMLDSHRYQSDLRRQQTTMREQAAMLDAEVQRRRQTVMEADQQVRVLEKLKLRQRTEYQLQQQRAEMKEMDEIASRSGRKT